MRCRLSSLAEEDLRKLWNYVAQDSGEERADKLIDAIFDRFDMLAAHPKAGRRRPEFGDDVRSFVVESHVIYYRAEEGVLLIARVLRGSRDQLAAWGEADDREP
jgi:toxin ParE1/3/4